MKRLTNSGDSDYEPAWSPDGTRLAFTRFGVDDAIYVVNVETKRLRRLTPTSLSQSGHPDWIAGGG